MARYFQPLDLTANGVAKTFRKEKFGNWYTSEVAKQLRRRIRYLFGRREAPVDNVEANPRKMVDLRGLYDHLRNRPDLIKKGFEQSGINDALDIELETEGPFQDLL